MSATAAEVKQFRSSLSKLGDIYVNEALAVAHLPHSSVVGCAVTQRACGEGINDVNFILALVVFVSDRIRCFSLNVQYSDCNYIPVCKKKCNEKLNKLKSD